MEEQIKDAWLWFGKETAEFGLRWLLVVVVMLGFGGFFGRRYRSMRADIAALKAQDRPSGLNQTFNFNAAADAHDHERQLRDAIETKTTLNLKETIRSLPQKPLGDGHTYATLPNGANIVSMADGTMRLALPVRLEAAGSVGIVASLSAAVLKTSPPERGKPDEFGADPDLGEKT